MNARALSRLYIALVNLYLVGVIGWVILKPTFGDRWAWLFLVNSFAFYLFLPLPLVLATMLIGRKMSPRAVRCSP